MNRADYIRELATLNPSCAKQVEAILSCGSRFCRITMKPQASDMEKRNGARRVYRLNVRATWKNLEKKYYGGSGTLTESGLKAIRTKAQRSSINIVENARPLPQGGTIRQCRTLVLPLIEEIKCGKMVYKF